MPKFTDMDGRDWSTTITLGTIKRLRENIGVNLLAIMDNNGELFVRLCEDTFFLVDVLFEIIQPQAKEVIVKEMEPVEVDLVPGAGQVVENVTREISRPYGPEDFANALGGDVLYQAHQSLLEGITDFFPNPQSRKALQLLIQKSKQAGDQIANHAMAVIKKTDVTKATERYLAKIEKEAAATTSQTEDSTEKENTDSASNSQEEPT